MYGITSQMRRCSAPVAANIAEGCGRRGNPEQPILEYGDGIGRRTGVFSPVGTGFGVFVT
ncbi:MAG: four helix bundle protein [Acidobacteriota bacterium]|nr:four helix bundle protein [Acidobacteriota bacterium]